MAAKQFFSMLLKYTVAVGSTTLSERWAGRRHLLSTVVVHFLETPLSHRSAFVKPRGKMFHFVDFKIFEPKLVAIVALRNKKTND